MLTNVRRNSRRLALALLLAMTTQASAREADKAYPVEDFTPRKSIGGFVSIPGLPAPPMTPESVRDSIKLLETGLIGLRLLGETSGLARILGFMATLHASLEEFAKADQLFDEAQKILEKNGDTSDLGWVHNNRGLVCLRQRHYASASESFRAALALLKPGQKDLLEPRAIALQNLASAEHILGDVEHAEDAYLEALDVLRRLGKENGLAYATTLGNLAVLYDSLGDFVKARDLLEKLLTRSTLSPPLKLSILNNLGRTLYLLKDFKGADARLKEALDLTEPGSMDRALIQTNLTAAYGAAGECERAWQEGQKTIALVNDLDGEESRPAAAVLATLGTAASCRGDLVRAESLLTRSTTILSRTRGDDAALAGVLQTLAIVAQRRGHREQAIDTSRKALELKKKHLEELVAFGSEAQRLAYRNNDYPYDQLANLGDAALLSDAVLATKGVVLDSLLSERALVRKSKSSADRGRLDTIYALKVELMEKIANGETDLDESEAALQRQETALARSVKLPVARRKAAADLAHVQAALAGDQVLIEIIKYQRSVSEGKQIPSYGGIVIPHQGASTWVPLGAADGLEVSIADLVARLDVGARGTVPHSGASDVAQLLRELDERLWEPLAKVFPAGTHEVMLSADGATNFLPWAALLDQQEVFLAERFQLGQVDSGRDLLRVTVPSADKTLVALADGRNDLQFSRTEVDEISRRADKAGWGTTVLVGDDASEIALTQHPRPRILHFATHGGQLHDDDIRAIENRLSRNPMYRGYLVLGGAAASMQKWVSGSATLFSEDGVLTAEEAGGLDLDGTWLTVLSACGTGTGEAMTGEGVLGLRRGFALAGSENLLFSLWSVDDEPTSQFMDAFYGRLFATGDLSRAFRETQVAELRRWKQTTNVSEAVHRAGGFVLTQ